MNVIGDILEVSSVFFPHQINQTKKGVCVCVFFFVFEPCAQEVNF